MGWDSEARSPWEIRLGAGIGQHSLAGWQPNKLPTETGENHHGSKVGVFLVSTCFKQQILWHTDAKTRWLPGSTGLLAAPNPLTSLDHVPTLGDPIKPRNEWIHQWIGGKNDRKNDRNPLFFSMGKFHGFPVDSHGKNLHEVHWIQHLPGFLLDIGPVTGRDKNGSHLGDWLWRNHWQFFGEFTIVYPLATNIAIENGHRNSGFSHWTWWFSIAMLNYQRVNHL